MMSLLTITDAAYVEINRAVGESSADDAVITLSQTNTHSSTDGLERMVQRGASEQALIEMGLYEHRFDLTPVRWRLECGVFERRDIPLDCLVEIRGLWFSFTPEWQAWIAGGVLDWSAGSLILKNSRSETLLPADLGYVTYEGP
jgi:hypothetical protein